jgi:hypothetical protein
MTREDDRQWGGNCCLAEPSDMQPFYTPTLEEASSLVPNYTTASFNHTPIRASLLIGNTWPITPCHCTISYCLSGPMYTRMDKPALGVRFRCNCPCGHKDASSSSTKASCRVLQIDKSEGVFYAGSYTHESLTLKLTVTSRACIHPSRLSGTD